MSRRSHSATSKGDDRNYFGDKPIFLPGWWRGLTVSQRWLFSSFVLFDVLGTVLYCASITADVHFEHKVKLVGLRPVGYPEQLVQFNLSITAGTGFWSNTANQRSASLQEEHISEVRKLIGEHIEVAVELWEFCVARAHRANACVQSAFVLLTLGLVGLFSGPFVVILSRRIMIYLSVGSVVFLMASFTLIYAASLEYNNCVIERQIRYMNEREFALVSYKGRYFVPSLKPNYQSLIGLLIAYLFGFFPMTAIGLYLTIKASLGL